MKKFLLPFFLSMLLVANLSAQTNEMTNGDFAASLRETVDLTTEEGCEALLFFNVATAMVDAVEKTQSFSPDQRTALARAWAPFLQANFSYENAAPLMNIALGVENPYGNNRTDTREKHLEALEMYGAYHDVVNAVAWFLVSSSEDPADHIKAVELLRGRKDLTAESFDTLGYAYHLLGHYDEALQCFFDALERLTKLSNEDIDPLLPIKYIGLRYRIGTTLLKMDRKQEALMAWTSAHRGLKEFAKQHEVDVNIIAIGMSIDFPRFTKQLRALNIVLKRENERTSAQP